MEFNITKTTFHYSVNKILKTLIISIMKSLVSTLLFFFAFSLSVFATPQVRDVLLWKGNKFYIFPFIDMNEVFDATEFENLEKIKTLNPPTSNHRGYSLGFEITNDSLFLVSVWDAKHNDVTMSVFGSRNRKPMINYSDTLFLGYGKSFWDEAFWTPVYENEMTLVFQKGVVQWVKDNKNKSNASPYTYNLQLFYEYVYSNIQWGSLNKELFLPDKKTCVWFEIDSVAMIEETHVYNSSGYNEFDEEVVRVLKSIPSFSRSFVCGKYIPHKYEYCFDFEEAKKYGINYETHSIETYRNDTINQTKNILNQIILNSVVNYTKDYNEHAKKIHYDTIQFICIDGLPNDIAFDSIPLGVFSYQWMEGNPTHVKKKLRHFTTAIRVSAKLSGNKIDVFISTYEVRRPRKRRKQMMVWGESGKFYQYEYSCNDDKWILKKD